MALKFWATHTFHYPDASRPYTELTREVVDIAQAAEDLGFEGISVPEHHFSNGSANPSALQMATFALAKTKRLKAMTSILVLPYYHPLALAGVIAAAEHMSEGRLELGVARGGNRSEFQRLGLNADDAQAMFDESIDVIKRAWVEDDITGEGPHYPFPETTVLPKPYTPGGPKLWVAAMSERSITAAAAGGANILTTTLNGSFPSPAELEGQLATYQSAAKDAGVDPGDVMVSRTIFIDETEEKALEKLELVRRQYWESFVVPIRKARAERGEDPWPTARGVELPVDEDFDTSDMYNRFDDPIMTSPEKAIARFKKYEALGVTDVRGIFTFGATVDEIIRSMEVMGRDVLPEFKDTRPPVTAAK